MGTACSRWLAVHQKIVLPSTVYSHCHERAARQAAIFPNLLCIHLGQYDWLLANSMLVEVMHTTSRPRGDIYTHTHRHTVGFFIPCDLLFLLLMDLQGTIRSFVLRMACCHQPRTPNDYIEQNINLSSSYSSHWALCEQKTNLYYVKPLKFWIQFVIADGYTYI